MDIAWKMLFTSLLAVLLCAASARRKRTTEAPLLAADSPDAIPNEYLVRLNPETTNVTAHLNEVNELLANSTINDSEIMDIWHIDAFRGYSVRMDNQSLDELRDMEDVMYVERNQEIQISCVDQEDAEWGLCRTTVRNWNPPIVTTYSYDDEMSGEGVDVYVLDTGVYIQHHDFGGRAKWGADFISTFSPKTDKNGHGTHVAGIIAGTKYGVAKKANIIAVRVLKPPGSSRSVVSGINWVVKQHHKGKKAKKSLANLSFGAPGPVSGTVNTAVKEAFEEGVIMVSAAGNGMQSACNFVPASADGITVAASDSNDTLANCSNYGKKCVEIVAPGVNIKSLGIKNPDATAIMNGTSQAAPHVTGVLAKYMSGPNAPSKPTYEGIKQYLDETSTKGKITYPPGITLPNSLIFMDCTDSVSNSAPNSTSDSTPNSAPLVAQGPFVILVCLSLSLCASMLLHC